MPLTVADVEAFWREVGKPGAKVRCALAESVYHGVEFDVLDADWSSGQIFVRNPDDVTGSPMSFPASWLDVLEAPKKCDCDLRTVLMISGCRCNGV